MQFKGTDQREVRGSETNALMDRISGANSIGANARKKMAKMLVF
jgi:hypothetical protein